MAPHPPLVLAARSWGDRNEPVALLLHGEADSMATWSAVAPWFADLGWNAIAMDLRGHGASASPAGGGAAGRALAAFARDVLETLRVLRPGSPHVDLVVGHSLGALVAQACVAEQASFARRLLLEDPLDPRSVDLTALAERLEDTIAAARRDATAFARSCCGSSARVPADLQREIADGVAAADGAFVPAAIAGLDASDIGRIVDDCQLPTLVLPPALERHAHCGTAVADHADLVRAWLAATRRRARADGVFEPVG